jgi:hypothetical protein
MPEQDFAAAGRHLPARVAVFAEGKQQNGGEKGNREDEPCESSNLIALPPHPVLFENRPLRLD